MAAILPHGAAAAEMPALTLVRRIRGLTPDEARKGVPVSLAGVVTFVDSTNYMSFLQDDSAGIFLQIPNRENLHTGDLVQVIGVTGAGDFTPVVRVNELKRLGSGRFPKPRPVSFSEFKSGRVDAEWVELEGRVRFAAVDHGWLKVKLALPEGIVVAWIRDPAGIDISQLAAADVRVQGVCAGAFGWEGEILDFELYLADASHLTVLSPALAKAQVPLLTISQLGLDWKNQELVRARCQGRVTLHWPDKALFIEDGTGSMELRTERDIDAKPGDFIEALGFPIRAHRKAILEDCALWKRTSGPPATPARRTLKEIYLRESHAELAIVEGELTEIVNEPRIQFPGTNGMSFESQPALVMKLDQWYLRAELPPNTSIAQIKPLRPGSRLELTGVLAADTANPGEPVTYHMLLQSPDSIRVTAQATWWTARHTFETMGVTGLAAVAAMACAVVISQRKRRQIESEIRLHHEETIRHQAVLLDLAKLPQGPDTSACIEPFLEKVADTLKVARVGVWRFESGGKILRRCDASERGKKRPSGETLSPLGYPAYFAALAESRIIAADDALNDPRTRDLAGDYLKPNGTQSMLSVPLRLRGNPEGVFCLEHIGDRRQWTIAEQQFATAAADQLILFLESGERWRAEQALRDSEEKFARAFHNSPDAFFIATLDSEQYLDVNSGFCGLSGHAKEDILGKTAENLSWARPEDRRRMIAQLRNGRHVTDQQTQIKTKTGENRDVLASCDVTTLSGKPCVIGVIHDITERNRAERALREAHAELELRVMLRTTQLAEARDRAESADRMKSTFLAAMSHELRTPLNSIIGFTGILHQGMVGPITEEQKKQLGMVMNSARHLLSLINDVLDISKIEANQVELATERFDLRESIGRICQIVSPLANRKSLPVKSIISDRVGFISSDRRRVEQILINLVNNAVKFTEHGEVRVECDAEDGMAVIRIADTGVGIRPGDMDKLFKPFQQLDSGLARQHEGTGLGLAICGRLVKLLGGEISVQSEFEKGSVFTVKLPLEKAPRHENRSNHRR